MSIEFDFVESIIRSNRIMYLNARAMIFFFFFLTRDYITRFFIFKFNLKKKRKVFKYLNIPYRVAYSSCHTFMNDIIYNQVIHIHINVIINQ